MLRADDIAELDPGCELPGWAAGSRLAAAAPTPHRDWQRSSYRASQRSAPVAVAGATAAVAALISAFLWLNVTPAVPVRHDLVTVRLATLPPPPPPREQPRPMRQQVRPQASPPPVVAPPPVVRVPAPSPVATISRPLPSPPVTAAPIAAAPVAAPPAPPPAVASVGDLSSTMISARPPTYPIESRRAREQGTVVLKLLLGLDGTVSDISVAQSSGFGRLDQAALTAVRKWRWKPLLRDGVAALVQGNVTIPFVLQH